jgi:hypothetical protein
MCHSAKMQNDLARVLIARERGQRYLRGLAGLSGA